MDPSPQCNRRWLLAGLGFATLSRPVRGADAKEVRSIWRIPILSPGRKVGEPRKAIFSPQGDWNPTYSPDGKKVVFESLRGETRQNWVSDADGSNAFQLTRLGQILAGTPRWSPQGGQIAFDATDGEIRVIPAGGGAALNLTNHPARDVVPAWSHDGRWIYFASNRTGEYEIWKTRAIGGDTVQVTRHGGHVMRESPDGRYIYYLKTSAEGALWRMPTAGGLETSVIDSVAHWAFGFGSRGVYFFTRFGAGVSLCHTDFAGRGRTTLATLAQKLHNGFSVSTGERDILYSRVEGDNRDK
jgi:hypothetical protein